MSVVEILFLGTFFALWTVFSFYFTLMLYFSRKTSNVKKKLIFPSISMVIPTFNEEKVISRKLKNIAELDYPKNKIEILIIDSGSTDNTRGIVRNFKCSDSETNIRLLTQEERKGKADALNYALRFCKGDLLILSDADVLLDKDSILQIVSNFGDARVGAVSGIEVILNPNQSSATKMEQGYRSFYNTLRLGESNLDSVVMCESEFSAYKRELLQKIPEESICDDMELTLRVREKGFRAIYDPNVKFYEYTPMKHKSRLQHKIRRGQGNQQALLRFIYMMFRPQYSIFGFVVLPFEFFMHVVSPILILICILSYSLIIVMQVTFLIIFPIILLSLMSFGVSLALRFMSPATPITLEYGSSRKLPFNPLLMIIGFLALQLCLLTSLISVTFGRSRHAWKKIEEIRDISKEQALNISHGDSHEISIVIPTYNRDKALKDALSSILKQTRLPKEVIIVDDSDNLRTKNLCQHKCNYFLDKGISLGYIHNTKEKSVAISRNIGIDHATGEIILFLDDDVILDEKYIEQILKVYKDYPHALGVEGFIDSYINSIDRKPLLIAVSKLFFLYHMEKERRRVLPSGNNTYPYLVSKIINCQCLEGSNKSYKRIVFEIFRFDEKLKGYAFAEDTDLSFRIYKNYPNSLYMTPHARLIHKRSQTSRLPKRSLIHIKTVYGTYFFYKNITQSSLIKLIFIWSKIGLLFICIGGFLAKKKTLLEIKFLMESYIYTLKHLEKIKRGDLDFTNKIFALEKQNP